MSPDGLDGLVDRVERAIARRFGTHPDAVTGRATERRCILASAVIAARLKADGWPARLVAGTLSVYRPGVSPLDIQLHALVSIGDRLLLDASISQAHRARFGRVFDVSHALLPVPSGIRDGRMVWLQCGDVRISFTPSHALTAQALATPDADPARVSALLDDLGGGSTGLRYPLNHGAARAATALRPSESGSCAFPSNPSASA